MPQHVVTVRSNGQKVIKCTAVVGLRSIQLHIF